MFMKQPAFVVTEVFQAQTEEALRQAVQKKMEQYLQIHAEDTPYDE